MGAVTWKAPDVERPQGPLTGPERPMLQAFLDWHRATLLYKCAGLTGEQMAGLTVPPSGLSLLGLVRHMTKVERTWFRQRFAGEPVDDLFGGDKTADFERVDPARAAADYARLTEEFKLADAAVAHASLDAGYFDVVHAHSVFSHSPIEIIEECLAHVGRVMKPDGFFDFTFDRTEGAEHQVLREDFYYRTETLVALAGRYGLTGQFMTDWEELPHQQSKLRITRRAELRYISTA